MATQRGTDRRLQDRALRKGEIGQNDLEREALELGDSAESGQRPSAEALEGLKDELLSEKAVRDDRIQQRLAEPSRESSPVAVAIGGPLDDEL